MCERVQVSNGIAQFLEWLALRSRPRTVEFYRSFLKRFAVHVGDIPLSEVKRLHIETFSAKHHALTAVCRFFKWAWEVAELIPTNPAAKVYVPKNGRRTRVLIRSERVLIRKSCNKSLYRATLAMEETACRPQELRILTWEMIFPRVGTAAICPTMGNGRHWFQLSEYKGKDRRSDPSKPRIIAITPRLGRLLDRMRRHDPNAKGVIFLGPSGRPWTANAFRCQFRRLRAKLQRLGRVDTSGLVPYVYRHTRATELARSGASAHLLKEWMGHSKVETSAAYCHLQIEDVLALGRRRWK